MPNTRTGQDFLNAQKDWIKNPKPKKKRKKTKAEQARENKLNKPWAR